MFKFFILINIVLLFVEINSSATVRRNQSPYDLEDEIREQVQELKVIVREEISTSLVKIDSMVTDVYIHRNERLEEARIAIRQGNESFNEQISTLKELAASADRDVEVCLANHATLAELSTNIMEEVGECLVLSNVQVTLINNGARYRIGILINEVDIFDFQLDLCAGDFLCMSPLVTQIELAKISIVQKIGTEVQNTEGLVDELKILITQCTDDKTAQFVTEGGIIVNQISDCVNDILS